MRDQIPEVDPGGLKEYLQSQGWHTEGTYRGADIWRLENAGRLLVPGRLEYDDDGELIEEAVRKLATYEERPPRDVLRDIADPMVDAQYYRTHPDAPAGMIQLPSGLRAVQGVHDLLAVAARTEHDGPRLLFEGRRATAVDAFLHRVLLGAAIPGSYVLTARVPVQAPRQPQLDFGEEVQGAARLEDLPGRAVVSRLHQGVNAAQMAARQMVGGGRMDAFYEGVQQGVSANLCRALADLGGVRRNQRFEIGFTWARGLPGQEMAGPASFTPSMVVVLENAGQELEHLAKSGQGRITGQVENLYLSPGEQPRIKVVGDLVYESGSHLPRRSLWVTVSMEQYDQAYDAQRQGWLIDVEGRLHTTQRRLEMHPSRFEVHRRHPFGG
jgi:hypothetical protein